MKNILLLCLFALPPLSANSQIKTPSFENYNICPDNYSQISYCPGWRQPTAGTCDYFNNCTVSEFVSVPQNIFGYQDNSIHAYTGLFSLLKTGFNHDYKEYIGTRIPTLVVGTTYTISVSVSLSDSSYYGTDGLGVLFTTYPYSQTAFSTIPLTPQVDFSSYGPITDKIYWKKLTGTFIADSNYSHLIVGCFKNESILNSVKAGDFYSLAPIGATYSYYYIGEIGISDPNYYGDSVYVHADTSKNPTESDPAGYVFPNAFTPNGDGINDVFKIIGNASNEYKGYILKVYNRWGECVYTSNNPAEGWNGIYKGTPQNTNVFSYMCEFGLNNKKVMAKGDVTLIR
jgi:gliding motility-associated-like protein